MRGNKLFEIIYSLIWKYLMSHTKNKTTRGKEALSCHYTMNCSIWFTLLNRDLMMTCHCESISILQSTSSFSQYKHAVHTSWLNGIKAKQTGQKKLGEFNPKCYYQIKSPIPQTYHFHCVLTIFKIDQSKQKAEALKHLWNTFPPKPLSNYKYVVGKK